jgi:uncharacterized protein YbjQ (UPF0145 family)
MTSARMGGVSEQEQRVLAGGVPDLARRRLSELVAAGMTSSFLGVGQYAVGVLEEVEPVGQVIGASACRLAVGVVHRTRGPAGRLPLGSPMWREHDGPIQSWTTARRRAVGRLVEQAKLLEADAVLGVAPSLATQGGDPPVVEVVLTGTAVRTRDQKNDRGRGSDPVVGLVSVSEFCLLRRAGVQVLGVVGSCSSVEVQLGTASRSALGGRWTGVGNVELRDLSDGVYEARRLAVERLCSEARGLKASGVISVDLGRWLADPDAASSHSGVTVHLLGTAIRGRPTAGVDALPIVRL